MGDSTILREEEEVIGEAGEMYRERGVGGSRPEVGPVADRKQRINEALDKQLERSSPSTSRAIMNGKDKVFMGKAAPDQRDSLAKSNFSDGLSLSFSPSLNFSLFLFLFCVFASLSYIL